MKLDVTAHHTYQSIREHERDLVAAAQRGNEAAMRILLQAHRPAIFRVAQRYVDIARVLGFADKFGIEDAFAYANFGYCRGIRKFDLARTTKLITYALHWSHHECERAMRDALGDIRVPVWAQKEGHRPVKALRLDSPVRMSNGFTSDETLGESVPDAEALSPEDQIDARRRAEKLRAVYVEVLSSLNERERELVLVRESYLVPPKGPAVACCAWGAYDLVNAGSEVDLRVEDDEYDAIECGWDGECEHAERAGLPMAWFEVGARLAAEFAPVPARQMEAR